MWIQACLRVPGNLKQLANNTHMTLVGSGHKRVVMAPGNGKTWLICKMWSSNTLHVIWTLLWFCLYKRGQYMGEREEQMKSLFWENTAGQRQPNMWLTYAGCTIYYPIQRDAAYKRATITNNEHWNIYRKAVNDLIAVIRANKIKYYENLINNNRNDSKLMGNTLKLVCAKTIVSPYSDIATVLWNIV